MGEENSTPENVDSRPEAPGFLENDWILLPVVALTFFLGLGHAPLFDLDEGAFSAATWEMLQRGDFITTYLNGALRFDKPILIYWFQAASVATFGSVEWAYRLPSAIAASFWVLAVYSFAKPRLPAGDGLASALIMSLSIIVWIIGRTASADALLNLWLTLTLLDIYRYWEHPDKRVLDRVFLWMGLGFLTKGPVAIVLPVGISVLFYASFRQWRDFLRGAFHWRGWLILIAVAGPWYFLEYQAQGQAFIDGFFLKHNVGRFTQTMENHGGSIFYYLPMLLWMYLPFTGMLVMAFRNIGEVRDRPLDRFLWIWFGVVFVIFSFSSTQLPHYLLYGSVPLFLLMAKVRRMLSRRWWILAPAAGLLLILPLLPEITAVVAYFTKHAYTSAMLAPIRSLASLDYRLWTLAGAAIALTLLMRQHLAPWRTLLLLGMVQTLVLTQAALPLAGSLQQGPVVEAARFAREAPGRVVMWGINMPSFTIYRGQITPRQRPQPGDWVFTKKNKADDFGPHEIKFQRGGIAIVELEAGATAPSHRGSNQ
jgi:4-amino-4-deoxy-L-arabinose transferase-like glycosyltransferase